MLNNIRYLQHTERARIEHDLTLTRISEVLLNSINSYVRGLFSGDTSLRAIVYDGLVAYVLDSNQRKINVTIPAIVVQKLPCNNIIYSIDANKGNEWEFTIEPPESYNRYDIIECQIRKRDTFFDDTVDVIEPISTVITPVNRPRDKEIYLYVRVKKGDNSGLPPDTTDGEEGTIEGQTTLNTPIDLSSRYLLKISAESNDNFIEIDLRGNDPQNTTITEIINKINNAGFGTIAYNVNNKVVLKTLNKSENSVIYVKQPSNPSLDAFNLVFGLDTYPGYTYVARGKNPYFKIAEIFVPNNDNELKTYYLKNIIKSNEWQKDNHITLSKPYELHRTNSELDHPNGSIYIKHLNNEVKEYVKYKITKFVSSSYARLFSYNNSDKIGRVLNEPINLTNTNGDFHDIINQEQEFTRSRLDQKQEIYNGGTYTTLTNINESNSHKIIFQISNPQIIHSVDKHQRVGFYVVNKGSGYQKLTVVLHDIDDNELIRASWNYNDLITGWVYFDLPYQLEYGDIYHYHIFCENFTGGQTATLGTNSAGDIAFRELYKPQNGLYNNTNKNNLLVIYDENLNEIVNINTSDVDSIVNCGDGYSSETAIDFMAIDTDYININLFEYNNYILVDLKKGIVKFPSSLPYNIYNTYISFNYVKNINNISTKEIKKYNSDISLDDWINKFIVFKNVINSNTEINVTIDTNNVEYSVLLKSQNIHCKVLVKYPNTIIYLYNEFNLNDIEITINNTNLKIKNLTLNQIHCVIFKNDYKMFETYQ